MKPSVLHAGALISSTAGLLCVIGAVVLLFWNAGQSVKICKTIRASTKAVTSVSADKVDPANQGKLVHVSGKAVTETTLHDPVFSVSVKALKLRRKVEMYPQEGPQQNPGSMPYQETEQLADHVTLGAFTLPASVVRRISGTQQVPVSGKITVPAELAGRAHLQDGSLYISKNPASPQRGDLRINFEIVPQQDISVIARQSGSSLVPDHAATGREIFAVREGLLTARHIFHKAEGEKIELTWRLRLLGFFLMVAGLFLILRRGALPTDRLPFLDNLVRAGTGIMSLLLAGVLYLSTIAAAWITFRPLLGIVLLLLAFSLTLLIRWQAATQAALLLHSAKKTAPSIQEPGKRSSEEKNMPA